MRESSKSQHAGPMTEGLERHKRPRQAAQPPQAPAVAAKLRFSDCRRRRYNEPMHDPNSLH